MTITLERLKELVEYSPETGLFLWRVQMNSAAPVGSIAGTVRPDGYRGIRIDKRHYFAHRLAWFYVHGEWPALYLDHINCDRADNRIKNLRVATRSQNHANVGRRSHNTSGFKGVTWHKRDRHWRSQIKHAGTLHHLGSFSDPALAHEAYCRAARQLFGKFARAG